MPDDGEAADTTEVEVVEPEAIVEEADTDSDVVDAEAPPIAVVEASLVDAGTTTTDATPPNTGRPLWKFWGGGEPVEAASELDNEGVGVPEPGDDGAG